MAVSKRTRFEVLRRDNYTCRYCRGTEGQLHVDHVTPVSLGGTDDPSNLVAACKDCNVGKASSSPDSETIARLTDEQIRYERARAAVVARHEDEAKERQASHAEFYNAWCAAMPNADVPDDWAIGVSTWIGRGLGVHRLIDAIHLTAGRKHVPEWAKYNYMAKIAWNWITELEEEIKAELSAGADSDGDSPNPCSCGNEDCSCGCWEAGCSDGRSLALIDVSHRSATALLSDRMLSVVVDGIGSDLPSYLLYDPEPIL